jgi:thioredoxin-related protein
MILRNLPTLGLLALLLAPVFEASYVFSQGAEINWLTMGELEAAQKEEPRKVMVDVYTKWCGPCKMMMRNTFTNGDVISYLNTNYYAVKFNAESPEPIEWKGKTYSNPNYNAQNKGRNGVHELSRVLKVQAYPTLVYFDENLDIIAPVSGYKSPQQIELYLKFFNEAWVSGISQEGWDSFQKEFEGTFK